MLSESAKQIAGRLDYVKIGDRVPFPETWKRLLSEWCSAMDDYIKQRVYPFAICRALA